MYQEKARFEPDVAHGRGIPEFKNILVDLDRTARVQPALDVAEALADRCGANLRVIDAMESPEGGAPHEVLLREIEIFGHDLIVRSQERDRVARAAVNKRLFRHSRCPVWAVGSRPKLWRPAILAAVNAFTHDPLTEALNAQAIQFALRLAELFNGDVTILHAWRQPAEERLQALYTETYFDALLRSTVRGAGNALQHSVESIGRRSRTPRVELPRGTAEQVIPGFLVSEGIDVLVAGARGERGIWPLVFGSTAERLLEMATCSVVAVKSP